MDACSTTMDQNQNIAFGNINNGLSSTIFTNNVTKPFHDKIGVASTTWAKHPEWVSNCFDRLYRTEALSDVTLDVGLSYNLFGKTIEEKRKMFRVHKAILSAFSNEFSNIFHTFSEMNLFELSNENNNSSMNIIRIEEDPLIFESLLYFIYTGRMNIGEDSNLILKQQSLIEMASRYGLYDVIRSCFHADEKREQSSSLVTNNHVLQSTLLENSRNNDRSEKGNSKENSSWHCNKCMNTFTSVKGFFRHAKRDKAFDRCWACVKCNLTETFQNICKALAHMLSSIGDGDMDGHQSFQCIICRNVCVDRKELLSHECSKVEEPLTKTDLYNQQFANIKHEPFMDPTLDSSSIINSNVEQLNFANTEIFDTEQIDDYSDNNISTPPPNPFLGIQNLNMEDNIEEDITSQEEENTPDSEIHSEESPTIETIGEDSTPKESKQQPKPVQKKRKGRPKQIKVEKRPKEDPASFKEKKKSTWDAINETKYFCHLCGKTLKGLTAYKRHQVVHTGDRPYACGTCGKNFTQNQRLTVHQRKHTGERPYLCSLCGKTFTESCKLKRHLTIVHKTETGGNKLIAGSFMGVQPLPQHQQPGGGGPLSLKKQQEFIASQMSAKHNPNLPADCLNMSPVQFGEVTPFIPGMISMPLQYGSQGPYIAQPQFLQNPPQNPQMMKTEAPTDEQQTNLGDNRNSQ